jgi:hypothetical protein
VNFFKKVTKYFSKKELKSIKEHLQFIRVQNFGIIVGNKVAIKNKIFLATNN